MRTVTTTRARRGVRVLAAALLVAAAVPVGLGTAGTTAEAAAPLLAARDDAGTGTPAYQQTKHLDRTIMVGGEELEVDSRDVTVTVDRTTELRGRERVTVSWTGARPSGGRAMSPFGELGLQQEYPVVILQCRGIDDPTLPPDLQLSPSTCWTSSRMQRVQLADEAEAVWRHDKHATEAERAQKVGLDTIPPECNDAASFSTRFLPFVTASGKVHPSCTSETMAPEAAVGAAFPPAEMAAFTDADGTGSVKFEVRTKVENESLGCSDQVACSIVVIPIQGISCLDDNAACNRGGQYEPGSSNYAGVGVDLTASPVLWWSASNWRNRFSIPISFGLPPDACSVLDSRAPTGFYGSELMSQAALQWSPAYCLDKQRFKFQHNRMSDKAGFALAESGGGAAAFVSSAHEARGTDPIAYAPTAVTGFAISYVVDRPGNAGPFTGLRLNARLLAKLMTMSYLWSELARAHPGMEANPVGLNLDPEFQKLNPGLDTISREAAASLMSLSEDSDVIEQLTSYIAADKDAMAFVNGAKDPWGMSVNPAYKKIELPTGEWPLLDDYVPPTTDECRLQNPTPYATLLAAPVPHLRTVAEAILDAWPMVQTRCERSSVDEPWKIGRVGRQGVGSRFLLGVTSLGDARRLGLDVAALEVGGGRYVGPTDATMRRALQAATPSKQGDQPVEMPVADVVKAGGYPGTMVVYTAARTANLPKADAAKVAQFIRTATTEGQRPGYGNGQLPPGYLPLTRTGPTAALWKQAQTVADLITAQQGATTGKGGDQPGADGPAEPDDTVIPPPPGRVPDVVVTDDPPADKPTADADADADEEAGPIAMPGTRAVSAPVTSRLVPVLGLVVLVGLAASTVLRLLLLRRRRSM